MNMICSGCWVLGSLHLSQLAIHIFPTSRNAFRVVKIPHHIAIDLPLDEVGGYTMQIALDDQVRASVRLQVRMGAPVLPASGMVS